MTERQLKYRSGLYLIALNLVLIGSIVLLRLMGGFDQEQFTTIFGIIVPMFSGYTTSIIAFIVKDRHTAADRSRRVTGAYAALVFVLPTLLSAVVTTAVWLQGFSRAFASFEDCKAFVMTFESGFAVYVGLVVYALFGRPKSEAPARGGNGERHRE